MAGRRGYLAAFSFAAGLAAWAAVLFGSAILPGHAYKLLASKWAHTTLGYTADPRVQAYTDAGLAQWAAVAPLTPVPGGPDIEVVVKPLLPPIFYAGQPAQANLAQAGGIITHCEVRLDPDYFFALTPAGQQNTVTHELGHCLGLDHSTVPSLMMNPLLYNFSDDDAAAVIALYGSRTQPAAEPTQPPAPTPTPAPPPPTIAAPSPVPHTEPPAAAAAAAPHSLPLVSLPPLELGWNLVTWADAAAPAAACGCAGVYRYADGVWTHWTAGNADYANTLGSLDPGAAYWMLAN